MKRPPIKRQALAPSTDGCMSILELLSLHPEGLSLSDIHRLLGISKNMVFRILNDLTSRGYTLRTEAKTYSLSGKLLKLAVPHFEGKNLVDEAAPEIKALRDLCGESTGLLVPCGNEAVLVYFQPSRQPIRIIYDLGIHIPLYSNAPGKVFLFFGADQDRLLKHQSFHRFTARTITDPARLQKQMAQALQDGYTHDQAEHVEGAHCVGAPVFDPEENLVAAIVITGPMERIPVEKFPTFGRMAAEAAKSITNRLKA